MQSQSTYNYTVVRQFAIMTVVWGIVGMLVGVLIAAQLIWPELNLAPWLSYGRLRPLHTNAVIFAFVGNIEHQLGAHVVVARFDCATLSFGGTRDIGIGFGSVPTGWSYGATGGANVPPTSPIAGDTDNFEFAYTNIPASPVSFTFTVNYPAGLTGDQIFSGIGTAFA